MKKQSGLVTEWKQELQPWPCPLGAGVAEPESTVPGWVMPAKKFYCEQTQDWGHRDR